VTSMSIGVPKPEAKADKVTYRNSRLGTTLEAVSELNVSIHAGEFVTIVGPSGCGKSTFLKVVGGLMKASGGEVRRDDQLLVGPGRDRAMVFQDASLFPWFTVIRNAAYGLECHGENRAEAKARARRYLELVGLSGFEDHYPYELSGGMQQRVNLARALAVEPQILLMDEPFAALDAQTRELMQEELLGIWKTSGKTVLFITHQIDEAVYLSDRVLVMSARPGRILADIRVDLPRPRSLDVKRTPRFLALEDEVWALIQQESKRAMIADHADRSVRAR